MKERYYERIVTVLCCVVWVGLIFGLVIHMDRLQGQSILQYAEVLEETEGEIYLLQTTEKSENGRYRMILSVSEEAASAEWMLSFVEFEPFYLYINGELVYSYEDNDGYQRVINVSLGEATSRAAMLIEIDTAQWGSGNYLYLGTTEDVERIYLLNMVLQALEIGFLLAVLIYAVSLFLRKTSERYLQSFFIYIITLLLWGCCQLEVQPLVINIQFFAYLKSLFNMLTILESIHVVLILNHRIARPVNHVLAWHNCLVASLIYARLDLILESSWIGVYFTAIPYVLGIVVCVYLALRTGRRGRLFTMVFLFSHLMRTVSYLSDVSGIAKSIYFNYYRTVPGFEIPFTVGCMLVINALYAGKFQESDELVEKLAEANQLLEKTNHLLEETNQFLDQKVEERTAQLRSQEQRKRQLMLNVFHDLRSPIFILRGYTEMMPAESQEAREVLSVMKEKLLFLHHLTEDLFLLSKLEENKIIFCADEVDLTQLLHTVTEAEKVEAQTKRIQLDRELELDCLMSGDSFRLEQAFQNIITNAIRYTPEEGRVQVRLRREKEELCVEVEDNGIGIPAGEIEKIFQLYYYRDRSSKSASTGLGLSITQEIVRHHGGTIEVKSEEGIGTTFVVRLPIENEMASFSDSWEE